MIIFVDIDETICRYEGERNYKNAIPILENIDKINKLYDMGHNINYWTARGSCSGIDHTVLTNNQLCEWGVKFHKLFLGKPHYDIFIDDKAINANTFFSTMKLL